MLVTDGGQIIRTPVDDVRIAGRNTQGVTLFDTADGERVASVSRLEESTVNGNGSHGNAGGSNRRAADDSEAAAVGANGQE